MGKRPEKDTRLKLPDDFLGTVTALLHTKPPKKAKRKKARKQTRKGR